MTTVGEKYLSARIGRRMEPWPPDLRFHSACPGRFGPEQKLERHPAIVALFRDIHTNEPRAIHRTFLRDDGGDRLRDEWGCGRDEGKKALGRHVGCAIKLSPDYCVTTGLGICEGIETGLSILAEGWAPVWAMCGTAGVSEFPVLAGIDCLTLFADHDENGAGRKAAQQAALRWCEAGRDVQIITPRTPGADWNDSLRGAA